MADIPSHIVSVIVAMSSAIAALFGAFIWAVKRLHKAHEDEVEYLRSCLDLLHDVYVEEKKRNGHN